MLECAWILQAGQGRATYRSGFFCPCRYRCWVKRPVPANGIGQIRSSDVIGWSSQCLAVQTGEQPPDSLKWFQQFSSEVGAEPVQSRTTVDAVSDSGNRCPGNRRIFTAQRTAQAFLFCPAFDCRKDSQWEVPVAEQSRPNIGSAIRLAYGQHRAIRSQSGRSVFSAYLPSPCHPNATVAAFGRCQFPGCRIRLDRSVGCRQLPRQFRPAVPDGRAPAVVLAANSQTIAMWAVFSGRFQTTAARSAQF